MTDASRTAAQRIAAGYTTDPHQNRRARVAGTYQPDPRLETMLKWRTTDPARYAQLSATTRIEFGYYEDAKRAAAAQQPDDAA